MTNPLIAVPQPTDIPANSQATFLANFNSIINWAEVDHGAYGTTTNGQHSQVTFYDPAMQPAPVNPTAIAYSNKNVAGADVNTPQMYYINATANLLVSATKAFGVFPINAATSLQNGFNIAAPISTATFGGMYTYTITLAANCVTGTNVSVFITTSNGEATTWSFATNPTLLISTPISLGNLSFLVLQL